jgi:hypothetical protein
LFMFNRDIIEHVCFQQRVPFVEGCPSIFASRIEIVKLFYFKCKTLQRKKKKVFLALNFRLAVNMLQLIYALKKHNN